MHRSRGRLAAALGLGLAIIGVTTATPPAYASSTVTIDESGPRSDPNETRDGVDYDATCIGGLQSIPPATPPRANSFASEPMAADAGCPTGSTYDGNTDSLDISSLAFESTTSGLKATWTVDRPLPAPGSASTAQSAFNLPDGTFTGGSLWVLYQNVDKQTNGDNPGSGCGSGLGRVEDRRGHWRDGYHFMAGITVSRLPGLAWRWTAYLGEYDPSPWGGFQLYELGTAISTDTDDGVEWRNSGAFYELGTHWSVAWDPDSPTVASLTFRGTYLTADPLCPGGMYARDFGSGLEGPYSDDTATRPSECTSPYVGDCLINIKGLTTADRGVTLPVTLPDTAGINVTGNACSFSLGFVCPGNVSAIGGFRRVVDTTDGDSRVGDLNLQVKDVAFTHGLLRGIDTLGPGPNCPWPTYGAVQPVNPLWEANQNQPCAIDETNFFGFNALFDEFWPTDYSIEI